MTDWAPDVPQVIHSELPPFGLKPHWVTFAFSAQANRLYDLYNAHVNRDRGDLIVWPTLDDLALMMGLSRGDKVTPYMRELETGGAVDVETLTKTGGNGRRYVITLKVHPPVGFTGPIQSSDWHHAKRDSQPARTTMAERARGVHPDEPADQEVHPLEGGYVAPSDGGDVHPAEGVVTKNKLNQNKEEQPQTAPMARSANDARRASAGSSACASDSGSAATDQTGPVVAADVNQENGGEDGTDAAAAPTAAGLMPQQRKSGSGGTGARKESPFPQELREAIYATEALLPAPLRALLLEKFPYGHLPNVNRLVTAQALETRTSAQLGERAARRWIAYGYERDHFDIGLRSPLGVVEELLRPTPYCSDEECEDGENVNTEEPCEHCEARIAERRSDRRSGRPVTSFRPTRLYRDKEPCRVCEKPFPGAVPDDLLCDRCRGELDRAAAHVNGTPVVEDVEEDIEPEHRASGPSWEYRLAREQREQAKRAALQPANPPF
ncbi:hypothetical protein ACFY0N_00825 [Streptomyces vinaceus]|uniref:hypothetical protein n=1 Tax=Streptomyces vinaceus TaxID=1960 RepID=UPI003699961B